MVVVAGGFFVYAKFGPASVQTAKAEPKPWVEVIAASVTQTASGTVSVLKTGDELEEGATVKTDAKGKANIYFPNGSVARLDTSSSIVLQEVRLSGSAWSVRLMLLGGRVWSKIGSVANVSTSWEVKTTNAVAVVRGTAFGMEYKNGVSRVLGAEHTVKVSPLDPKTGDKLADKEVEVTETKFVEIRDDKLEAIKENKIKLQAQDETKAIQNDSWFKENKRQDSEFQNKIDKAETRAKASEDDNIDTNSELKKEILIPEDSEPAPQPNVTNTKPETNTGSSGGSSASIPKPLEVVLSSDSDLSQIKDGGKASLKAFLKMSDGSKKDVTAKSRWNVSKEIGSVGSDGVFNAAIDPNLGDVPEAEGDVTAVWEENGVSLSGKSHVKVFPDTSQVIDIGGQ